MIFKVSGITVMKVMRVNSKFFFFILVSSVFLFASFLNAQAPNGTTKSNEEEEGIEYAKDSSTEINVKNADIAAVVRIFSKKTKRNYILDENVKGKVTIYLPGRVSSEEAIRILDSVLALKGFTSVPIGENLWKIVASKDAKTSTIPTLIEDVEGKASSAVVTRLLQLKYTNAEDIQQLVSQLVSPEGLINAYTGTNSLIIIDSEDNIERLAQIINSLDVPSSDRDMTIMPVKHADAVELATKLNDILGTSSDSSKGGSASSSTLDLVSGRPANNQRPGSPVVPGQPGLAMPASLVSSKTVSARSREPKIIPDERTNSIIIVADEDTTARMKALITQLDSEIDLSGNRFYVYRCQHASAEELSEVLAGLVGEGGGSSSKGSFGGGSSFNRKGGDDGEDSAFGGSNRNTNSRNRGDKTSRTQDRLSGQQRTPGRSRSENQSGAGGPSTVSLGENVSITADPATNSLIISAGKSDYEKLLELLKQLDIKRRQVLVEAVLLEVGVDESTQLSTEFLASTGGADGGVLAKSDFNNLGQLLRDPTGLSNFSVAAASSGTLTLPGNIQIPTQAILVSAARENANVNVLSAPNILTTDNEQAEIIVGQNVPFLASTATSDTNLNNTFNQIDRQDVGITLRLTPQINSENYVTLAIFTEVSSVLERTSGSELGPTTLVRTSETTIIAKDGQMIVIGGLMSDDNAESETGVPFLSDVPVLGHLFRSSRERSRRTNLLIFITPRVLRDQFDARENTVIKREHMEDVIAREQTYPDHADVLNSPDIDNIAESSLDPDIKPGTILAPDKKISQFEKKKVETSRNLNSDSEGVIELKVAPKLPGQASLDSKKKDTTVAPSLEQPIARNAIQLQNSMQASLRPDFTSDEQSRIVIMTIDGSASDLKNLPFTISSDSSSFAVQIPGDSNAFSRGFFQIGQDYSYKVDGTQLLFKPTAILNSEKELRSFYPELASKLYTLSPYEIMNMGLAPWVKRGQ